MVEELTPFEKRIHDLCICFDDPTHRVEFLLKIISEIKEKTSSLINSSEVLGILLAHSHKLTELYKSKASNPNYELRKADLMVETIKTIEQKVKGMEFK
jgi:hypothetical protein